MGSGEYLNVQMETAYKRMLPSVRYRGCQLNYAIKVCDTLECFG